MDSWKSVSFLNGFGVSLVTGDFELQGYAPPPVTAPPPKATLTHTAQAQTSAASGPPPPPFRRAGVQGLRSGEGACPARIRCVSRHGAAHWPRTVGQYLLWSSPAPSPSGLWRWPRRGGGRGQGPPATAVAEGPRGRWGVVRLRSTDVPPGGWGGGGLGGSFDPPTRGVGGAKAPGAGPFFNWSFSKEIWLGRQAPGPKTSTSPPPR